MEKCSHSDSFIPLAPPWEPPHHLQLALGILTQAVAHNGLLFATVPDSPSTRRNCNLSAIDPLSKWAYSVLEKLYRNSHQSIQSYTGNYHEFVAVVFLRVVHTNDNIDPYSDQFSVPEMWNVYIYLGL